MSKLSLTMVDSIKFPDEWAASSLKEVGKVTSGNAFKSTQFVSTGVPVVKISNIQYGEYIEKNQEYLPLSYINEFSNFQIESGDLLLALTRPITNGQLKVCKYPKGAGTALLNQRVAKLETSKSLTQQFFEYYLRSKSFLGQVENGLSETLQPNLSPKALIDFIVPLPPLAEQKVIANKLDELLAQVESTKTRLDAIPAILKSFRQSVLAAAVSGKLTEEWRGTSETIDWKNGLLGEFVIKPTYGSSAKSNKDGLVPVLRMGNLQGGKLDWSSLVYTSDKEEIDKYKLNAGDVLFNRTNSPELVGKTSIFRGEREAIYAGYLIKMTCLDCLNPEFLNFHLNSLGAKEYCRTVKSDGVSQSNINAKKLAAYPMSLPSIREQTVIVRRIEQLFAFADEVESQVNEAQARVNNLTQSILAKAFRGELTADWRAANPSLISGDNSAEVLLERIKAAKKKPAKKPRDKKAKA